MPSDKHKYIASVMDTSLSDDLIDMAGTRSNVTFFWVHQSILLFAKKSAS